MKRRLLNLAAGLSLLLCVAAVASWVRSMGTFDRVTWRRDVKVTPEKREEQSLHAMSVRGRLFFVSTDDWYRPYPPGAGWTRPHPEPGVSWRVSRRGGLWSGFEMNVLDAYERESDRTFGVAAFGYLTGTTHGGPTRSLDVVTVPHGLVATAFALPAAAWAAARLLRRRRRAPGLCRACGYDLRATPGRCPECGAAASLPSA